MDFGRIGVTVVDGMAHSVFKVGEDQRTSAGLGPIVRAPEIGVDIVPITGGGFGRERILLGIVAAPGVQADDKRPGMRARGFAEIGALEVSVGGRGYFYPFETLPIPVLRIVPGRPGRCGILSVRAEWSHRDARGIVKVAPAPIPESVAGGDGMRDLNRGESDGAPAVYDAGFCRVEYAVFTAELESFRWSFGTQSERSIGESDDDRTVASKLCRPEDRSPGFDALDAVIGG